MQHTYVVIKGHPFCLSRGLEFLKEDTVYRFIKTIEYTKARKFKLVKVYEYDEPFREYNDMGNYWADIVTGTLYNPKTGECMSSTQIQMVI